VSDLHWLYVHGASVGQAFVTAAAAVGIGLSRVRAARAARASAKTAAATLGRILTKTEAAPAQGTAVFEGELVPGVGEGPGELALKLDDGEIVPLNGPLNVLFGARAGRRAEGAGVGDRVAARGEVVRAPKGEAKGYRGTESTVALDGAPSIDVVAVRPRARPSVRAVVVHAALGALAGVIALGVLGAPTAEIRDDDDGTHLSAHAVAAITPSRRFALHILRSQLERHTDDAVRRRRAADVSILLGDCGEAVETMLAIGDTDAAEKVAGVCPHTVSGKAYLQAGEIRAATRAYATTGDTSAAACSAYVLGHAWSEAATCMARLAEEREPHSDPGSVARKQGLVCIANALDARAGNEGALAKLKVAASARCAACSTRIC
jgi:hypothetical protein